MTKISKSDFVGVVANIKNEIRTTQVRTMQQVNNNLIMMYFRIGKILAENSKYGNKFIENIAMELKLEFPDLKGFSGRNLRRMKLFYYEYKDDEKWPQLVAKLPWGQNVILMEKIKDLKVRELYMRACLENGWSRSMLEMQIESQYHLRIGNSTNNFKAVLPPLDSDMAEQSFKDPYIFDFLTLREGYKEKELESAMLGKIKDVLMELGKGFAFVGNQYKISTKHNDYYIDMLFYHLELQCYVVVELKATEFKPEYLGQLSFYVTAINETLKKDSDNPTIGLLICKNKDKLVVKWSLKGTNLPVGVSTYELDKYIPENIAKQLPSEEELNLHFDVE